MEGKLSEAMHPMAPHHLPFYVPGPDGSDPLMVVMGIFLIVAVLGVGNLYLRLHSLPERMAHKSEKFQFEIVAMLCLISLFTHIHLFWIVALLLAVIDIPDFGSPLRRIAGSVEKIAGDTPESEPAATVASAEESSGEGQAPSSSEAVATSGKVRSHA